MQRQRLTSTIMIIKLLCCCYGLLPICLWAFVPLAPQMRGNGASTTSLQESMNGEEIQARLQLEIARLREKDRNSRVLTQQELQIVHEDEDIIVVEKPSGVLCVPSEKGVPSLAQVVYERLQQQLGDDNRNSHYVQTMNQIVVHRLGMHTSGLIIFVKTMEALRDMNALFRSRKIMRRYEALLCGHLPQQQDQGFINLPLMRDYENPPYMRVSTNEHQQNLLDVDPSTVDKKLLVAPKNSLTLYSVINREYLFGNEKLPVTRVTLTSMSGRTHQLNVHCAAFGHPIVGDQTYGINGRAAPNGGIEAAKTSANEDLQRQIADAVASAGKDTCVHATHIQFRHPITKESVEFSSPAPF